MRATHATVDLARLRSNLGVLAGAAGPEVPLCLAVKANAYGHGITAVARAAVDAGVSMLGVATVDEAVSLRDAAVAAPVLLLGLPSADDIGELVASGAQTMVADLALARELSATAGAVDASVAVHIKVDTGMGRIGCPPERAGELWAAVAELPHLDVAGIATHFARADEEQLDYTRGQLARFLAACDDCGTAVRHAANSAALLRLPESRLDMARPGIAAYGIRPSRYLPAETELLPALRWTTRIVQMKQVAAGTGFSYGHRYHTRATTWIATLPVGYGDGYRRGLSDRAQVAIGGRRYPVVGTICMDQCLVDIGPRPTAAVGDEVTLIGDPPAPSAEELAAWLDTIPYEVLTGIAARVPRRYEGDHLRGSDPVDGP